MNPVVYRLFFAQLCLITLLSGTAMLIRDEPGRDALLWLPVLCLLEPARRLLKKRSDWTGAVFFAVSWLAFPLLKPINDTLLPHNADALLNAVDRALWGGRILPAYFRYEDHPWLTDILAAAYFGFYALAAGSVVCYARARRSPAAAAFFNGLLACYGIGFTGYFLLPAAGPAFTVLPDGGAPHAFARYLLDIVKNGVTGMDVFPSLHTAVSLYCLGFLALDGKRLAACLLLPVVLGTLSATVYLRYHYGIDVLAGIVLAAVLLRRFSPRRMVKSPTKKRFLCKSIAK